MDNLNNDPLNDNLMDENALYTNTQNQEDYINDNPPIDNYLIDQDDALNFDDLNKPGEEIGYVTDSDIDDPKYIPTGNNLHNLSQATPNRNEMFLQSKILDLQNDAHMQNQTMMELENENNLLKTEI